MTKHVVMYSGGIGSWAAALRVVREHGPDDVTLLFADTKVEDADTYRFRDEGAAQLGADLVIVADGRTPFEVFEDNRYISNSRVAHCSRELKQDPCRRWVEDNCDLDSTIVYVGISWMEEHRLKGAREGWEPWVLEAPLCEEPLRNTNYWLETARVNGLEPPKAYARGLPHANCLAQGCVRGGQAYWNKILEQTPEVYAATEEKEHQLGSLIEEETGKRYTIMKDRSGGTSTPLSLRDFRKRLEEDIPFDELEWGGCGCFVDDGT